MKPSGWTETELPTGRIIIITDVGVTTGLDGRMSVAASSNIATRTAVIRACFGFAAAQLFWVVLIRDIGSPKPITLLACMSVALCWGVGAWLGVSWRKFRVLDKTDRSASWTGALWGGAVAGVTTGCLLLGEGQFRSILDAVALSTMVVFLGAKLGCVLLGCCPGALQVGHQSVWPAAWGRSSLAVAECFAIVACCLAAAFAAGRPGGFGMVLVTGHVAIRLSSRVLRSPSLSPALFRPLVTEMSFLFAFLVLLAVTGNARPSF